MSLTDKDKIELAHERYGLIAPALNNTYPDESKAAYFRRIAQTQVRLVDGSAAFINPKTLADWERRFKKGGFEALMPRGRSDNGSSRKIDEDLAIEIAAIRMQNPKMNATMVYEKLIVDGVIAKDEVSLSTMQRWFKKHPLNEQTPEKIKDRRSFESAFVNGIWQADTLYGPPIGETKRTYLQTIIDDKSRMVVAARFFPQDNATSFQTLLKQAVGAHGVPEKLYVDNGGPYKNYQLAYICGKMGCALVHAPVRDGAAKGKIERFNRTVRMRFLSSLDDSARTSFEAINDALAAWIIEYNSRVHSTTKQKPIDIFAQEADRLRYIESADELDEIFRNKITRKVAKDATVRIDNISYDAPMACISERLNVYYTPANPNDIWIEDSLGKRHRLTKTDKVLNANSPRVKQGSKFKIDYNLNEKN